MTDEPALPTTVPALPADEAGPVFNEPWEARAFAMAVALNQAGVFSWRDWAAALGEEIAGATEGPNDRGQPEHGTEAGRRNDVADYYRHWLAALERMAAQTGLADRRVQALYRDAWSRATDRTPHGSPIELQKSDFGA
jgi:nitrile hydratase accessory protein